MVKIIPMTPPSLKDLQKAMDAPGTDALAGLLATGLDASWTDKKGNTLVHHAAKRGDVEKIKLLLAHGAPGFSFNANNETPRDVAIIWGNHPAANALPATGEGAPLQYKSMQEIRDAAAAGKTPFYDIAARGQFAQLVTLAEKDGGLTAGDMLEKGFDGDTAALKIAQRGQVDLLLNAQLWMGRPDDFQKTWDNLPGNYRSAHDYNAFIAELRQAKLQSYAKPRLPKLKPGL